MNDRRNTYRLTELYKANRRLRAENDRITTLANSRIESFKAFTAKAHGLVDINERLVKENKMLRNIIQSNTATEITLIEEQTELLLAKTAEMMEAKKRLEAETVAMEAANAKVIEMRDKFNHDANSLLIESVNIVKRLQPRMSIE